MINGKFWYEEFENTIRHQAKHFVLKYNKTNKADWKPLGHRWSTCNCT